MKARRLLFAFAFCTGTTLCSVGAFAQAKDEKKGEPAKPAAAQPPPVKPADKPADKPAAPADKPADKPAAPAAKPADKPAGGPGGAADPGMDAMMKAGMAGEFHAKLKPMDGSWNAAVKFWMDPASQPAESKGTCDRKWLMDGRFLEETHNGDMMGMPFKGYGITGYDNLAKKYVNSWINNMGTGIMMSTGSVDASGKVFTYTSENVSPMTGKMEKSKSVVKIVDDKKHTFEMYMVGDDGKEFKSLEITYTKK